MYAEETGAAFGPWLELSLKCVLGMGTYFHESVRLQAFEALPRLLMATLAAFPSATKGAFGASCLPRGGVACRCQGCRHQLGCHRGQFACMIRSTQTVLLLLQHDGQPCS